MRTFVITLAIALATLTPGCCHRLRPTAVEADCQSCRCGDGCTCVSCCRSCCPRGCNGSCPCQK